MVDLEKIKREVKEVCRTLEAAFISLADKSKEHEEAERQIDRLKSEIVLLQERKANVAVDVRNEQELAQDKKKEYTDEKVKYRKLIDEENLAFAQVLAGHQSEIDVMRTRGMSQIKAEQGKVISEIEVAKRELGDMRKEYTDFKNKLLKLKEGIVV